jgi:hypothetical protein
MSSSTAVIFFFVALAVVVGGPITFIQARRILREQKNYERGLKMVTLRIQLPPPSEDIELGQRDTRDITEENISKAQTLYSIIAGTLKKDFKSKFYGQRHFSFEIVGAQGLIHFYAVVPVALVDVVKQAVISAYPTSALDEVAEQNIFSPIGKISGTLGGELTLKESYAYPIATYEEVKRDAIQGVLNALSSLDKDDGAGIQILIRPANPNWRKIAGGLANSKRSGSSPKAGSSRALSVLNQIAGNTPSESGGDSKEKKVSHLDQNISDAMEEKLRYPGFEVLIRVVASSNISSRAQTILRSIVSSFALYDSPGKNGFKYTVAKDMERFVTAYILRFFPPENDKSILNSVELATLFHFPDRFNIPTSQLERQSSKQVDGPRNMPETGLLLGYNVFRGVKKPIRLSLTDRQRHMYVVGQTGTGKSTFLENLALQDMLSGGGFAFVDPHGDAADRLLGMVPKDRTEDVIYFSPAETEYPMGLNLFEFNSPEQKDFLIQEALNMLQKLYDPQHQGIMGPRYDHLFRNAALTVMADPAGGTFIDIPKLFRDPQFVRQKLQYVTDQNVLEFWQKEVPQSQRSNEYGEVTSWFVSKFGAFLSNDMMRNIIGQTKSAFNLREVMDEGKILLVNLSKGKTGELNSKLLGMVFVMKFQAAAMSRSNIPESERKDFCLYVDEFQNFSTDSFATIMSEARKYHLNLIVANQFTTQLSDEIRDAVFGNMGTIVSFRVGQNDVDILSKYYQPLFDGEDLLRVPNHNAIVRTMINGVPTQPFSMASMPPLGVPNPELELALKQLSAAKYGHPRATVEADIFGRLATKEPPRPAYNSAMSGGAGGFPGGQSSQGPRPLSSPTSQAMSPTAQPSSGAPVKPPVGTGSFLDEWLSRTQAPASPSPSPSPSSPTPQVSTPAQQPLSTQPQRPFNQPDQQFLSQVQQPNPSSQPGTNPSSSFPFSESNYSAPQPATPTLPPTEQVQPPVPEPTKEPEPTEEPKSDEGKLDYEDIAEFKIPRHPNSSQTEDTIYIDPSGNMK